jgi:hypothetical protein
MRFFLAWLAFSGETSEQFTQFVRKEASKWADVVKRTRAKVD